MTSQLGNLVHSLQNITERGITSWTETINIIEQLHSAVRAATDEDPESVDTKLHMEARTLLSEIYDYQGRYNDARSILAIYPPEKAADVRQAYPKMYPRMLLQKSRVALRQGNIDRSLRLVDLSINSYHEQKINFGLGLAYFWKAVIYFRQRNFRESSSNVYKANEIFINHISSEKKYRIGISKVFLARLTYRISNNFDEIRNLLVEANSILGNTEDLAYRARIYDLLGRIARAQACGPENYNQAEQYFMNALELYEKAGNGIGRVMIYNNLGYLYTRTKDFDQAKRFLTMSESFSGDHEEERLNVVTTLRLGQLYFQWGKDEKNTTYINFAEKHAKNAKINSVKIRSRSLEASSNVLLAHCKLLINKLGGDSGYPEYNFSDLIREIESININKYTKRHISMETAVSCKLMISLSHCWQFPDKELAQKYYEEAKLLLIDIQNEFLWSWLDEVRDEIEKISPDFYIPHDSNDLNIFRHEARMRFFLLRNAVKRAGKNKRGRISREQVGHLLGGVSRHGVEKMVKAYLNNTNGVTEYLGIGADIVRQELAPWFEESNDDDDIM